jgi:hypothetical protein
VASIYDCKNLILETPYYSVPDIFACYAFIYPTSRMANYKIPTYEYLQEVKAPITIFHGTNDGVDTLPLCKKIKSSIKTFRSVYYHRKGGAQ